MFYITYNDVITPQSYKSREEAIKALSDIFPNLEFDNSDIAFWPSISARGNTKIEIKQHHE